MTRRFLNTYNIESYLPVGYVRPSLIRKLHQNNNYLYLQAS